MLTGQNDQSKKSRWLPLDFPIPSADVSGRWKVRRLGTDHLLRDYAAIMSSIDHLQRGGFLFPPDTTVVWPLSTWTLPQAIAALGWDELGNLSRTAMSFAVMSPDKSEEYGCIYVLPSAKVGWQAQLMMWTTAARYEELDAELWAWAKDWVRQVFPFDWERVACPGREIPWDEWESLEDAMEPVANRVLLLDGTEALFG